MATKAAIKPETDTDQNLTGVEIFRAGTYVIKHPDGTQETVTYSNNDVKEMSENGNALLAGQHYEAPAKLGHSEDQKVAQAAGLPAAGWVTRLYTKTSEFGEKLVADFKQVPAKLAEAIRRGRYKFTSSEIYDPKDTESHFGEFGIKGFTLRAVAFLGADIPVVKGNSPLMLAAGADGARTITIPVKEKTMKTFSEEPEDKKPLMVPANRHPYGALVKNTEDEKDDGPHVVHAVHPDGTYDTHPLHGDGKAKTAVPHDNLTLLSESEYRKIKETTNMDAVKLAEIEKTAAADKAALAAERAENKRLREGQRDAKITAFAEKYKEYGLTAALKPSFEAVAKMDISTPVKLAEGKELPFVDAFLAFAEGVIKQRQMITGELTPATGDEAPKEDAVKLAELPYQAHAAVIHGEVTNGELAVKARKYSEEHNVPYKKALLAVAALSQEVK